MRMSDGSADVCSSDRAPKLSNRRRHGPARGLHQLGAGHPGDDGRPIDPAHFIAREKSVIISLQCRARFTMHIYPLTVSPHLADRLPVRVHPGLRSEEHTSELQSLMRISYAVFCLKKTLNTIHLTCPHNSNHTTTIYV